MKRFERECQLEPKYRIGEEQRARRINLVTAGSIQKHSAILFRGQAIASQNNGSKGVIDRRVIRDDRVVQRAERKHSTGFELNRRDVCCAYKPLNPLTFIAGIKVLQKPANRDQLALLFS